MSQTTKILTHMRKHGSITSLEAFQHYHITRLSSRICELEDKGIEIKRDYIQPVPGRGAAGTYCRYYIAEK